MKTRKIVAVLLLICMITGLFPGGAYGAEFTDTSGHWAEEIIAAFAESGVITGNDDGSYGPDVQITRAEFFTMINRALGLTEEAEISFHDVAEDSWYAADIRKAVAAGYLKGYEDGTVRPEAVITRAESAAVMCRILELEPYPEGAERFADFENIPDWARGYIGAAAKKGLMRGYDNGEFGPGGNLTRAESASLLSNAVVYIEAMEPDEEPEEEEDKPQGNIGGIVQTVRVESVSLGVSELTLQIGQSESLSASVLPEKATNKSVTWSSGNEEVAKVSGGTVTPVSVGRTVIMAKTADGGFTALVDVRVTAAVIDSNTVPLKKYDGDVTIRVGAQDINLSGIQFNGNVTIEEEETVQVRTYESPVRLFAAAAFAPVSIIPQVAVMNTPAVTQFDNPVITPFATKGGVRFTDGTSVASMDVNAETEVTTDEGTSVERINAKKNATLNLSGPINKINVDGAVTLKKLTVAERANPEVTGGGTVDNVEVKARENNNLVGLTIMTRVNRVDITPDPATGGGKGGTIGTLNIGGNNTNTEVNIKNVTVNRVVITDTAAPLIIVDADSIIETVTALSDSTKDQTRIEGEGSIKKLQRVDTSNQGDDAFDTISLGGNVGKDVEEETIENVLTSMEVTTPPSKTVYMTGESFDSSGISVTGTYEISVNGTIQAGGSFKREVRSFTVGTPDLGTVGSKTVTVTSVNYPSVTASFTVTVRADKTALAAAITSAKAAVAVVDVSADGNDISMGKGWVTPAEKTAINSAIAAAETVNGKQGATVAEVSGAVSALNSAMSAFVVKDGLKSTANKTALTTALIAARAAAEQVATSSVEGRDLANGTRWVSPARMQSLNDAIAAANAVFGNNSATQEEINPVTSALETALSAFNTNTHTAVVSTGLLSAAITAAENAKTGIEVDDTGAHNSDWVPAETMAALNNSIAAASRIVSNALATQIEVDNALSDLEKTTASFRNRITSSVVDDSPLSAAIAAAKAAVAGTAVSETGFEVEQDSFWVTQAAADALNSAITAAEATLSGGNLTRNQVAAAATELRSATMAFNNSRQAGTKPDKTALTEAIEAANAAKTDVAVSADGTDVDPARKWVTQSAMTALDTAITAAQTVSNNAAATQAQIDGAVTALNGAVTTFNGAKQDGTKTDAVEVDKTALNDAITAATTAKSGVNISAAGDGSEYEPDKKWVTQGDADTLDAAITAAQTISANEKATETEVANAVTALNNAVTAFNSAKQDGTKLPPVDKTALTAAITAASSAKSGVTVNAGPASSVSSGVKFVTQAEMNALDAAITAAQTVNTNEKATQAEVDAAVTALNSAVSTFNSAIKTGTYVAPTPLTSVTIDNTSPKVGDTLGATVNPNGATVTYSWEVGGTQKGTDSSSYLVTKDDVGKTITVTATGTGSYEGTETSGATSEVQAVLTITATGGTDIAALPSVPAAVSSAKTNQLGSFTPPGSGSEKHIYGVSTDSHVSVRNAGGVALTYAQSAGINLDKVRLNVSLSGDEDKAYLIASDGGKTFELIKTGFMGLWDGQEASSFDSVTTLTFFAIEPGTYTLTFDLVDVSDTSDLTSKKIATTTLTFTVTAAEASLLRSGGTTTYYGTLETALDAATTSGDVVTLLSDAEIGAAVTVESGVTLKIEDSKTLTVPSGTNMTVNGTVNVASGKLDIKNGENLKGTGTITGAGAVKIDNAEISSGKTVYLANTAYALKTALNASAEGDTVIITGEIGKDVKNTCTLHDGITTSGENEAGYYNFRVTKAITIRSSGNPTIYGNFTIGKDDGSPVEGASFIGLTIVTPRLRFSGNTPSSSKVFLYAIGGVTNNITITNCTIGTSSTVYTGNSGSGYDCVYRGISLVPTEGTAEKIEYNITGTSISFDQSAFGEVTTLIVSGLSGIAVMSNLYSNEGSNWTGRYPGVKMLTTYGAQNEEDAVAIFDEIEKLTGNTTGVDFPKEVEIAVWYGAGSTPGSTVVTNGSRDSYNPATTTTEAGAEAMSLDGGDAIIAPPESISGDVGTTPDA